MLYRVKVGMWSWTLYQVAAIPFSMSDAEELKALERGWAHSFGGEQKTGFYIGRPHASLTELRVVRSVKTKDEGYMVRFDLLKLPQHPLDKKMNSS